MKKLFSLILIAFFATTLSASAIKTYQISEDVQAGIKEYRKQNYAGAMAEFKKAIAKNPNDSFAHYYLGNVYAAIGKNAEADGSYSKVAIDENLKAVMDKYHMKEDSLGEVADFVDKLRTKEYLMYQVRNYIK